MEAQIALAALEQVLGVPRVSIEQGSSFASHGGDSLAALKFSVECKRRGLVVPVDAVLSSPSIAALIERCRLGEQNPEPNDNVANTEKQRQQHLGPATTDSTFSSPWDALSSLGSSSDSDFDAKDVVSTRSSGVVDDLDSYNGQGAVEPLHLVFSESEELFDPAVAPPRIPELSATQISLVHGSIHTPGSNTIHYYETYHPDQVPAIKLAWKQVLRAEAIFCSRYRNPEDGCLTRPRLQWREFTTTSEHSYRDAISASEAGVHNWPDEGGAEFELVNRFTVVHLEDRRYENHRSTVVWSVHHALIDGWSAANVLQKVRQVFKGLPVEPGPSFVDFAVTLDHFRQSNKADGLAFWTDQKEKLEAAQDDLLLPPPMNSAKPGATGEIRVSLDRQQHALKAATRSCGVTPATLFHAAWAMVLALYTDSDSVKFGTVLSGRNIPLDGIFSVVGPLVCTLPIQVDISWRTPVRDLLHQVFSKLQTLAKYSWTTPEDGFSRAVGSLMALQVEPPQWDEASPVTIERSYGRQTSNLPLAIIITDDDAATLQYSHDRYAEKDAKALAKMFGDTVQAFCRVDDSLQSCAAGLLPMSAIETLRIMGNCESAATTKPSVVDDLVTLFEAAATARPSDLAIESTSRQISYGQLEQMSGRLASKLVELIEPEEVVTVYADGSVNWLVSIWGILRAGGTYCPLESTQSQPYLDSLFESSTARYFLATDETALAAQPATAVAAFDVEAVISDSTQSEDKSFGLRARPRPWERAYLCFTSGSTGKPKGVMCTHQGLVAFQRDLEVRLRAQLGVRIAQIMSVAFDGSIHELFSALCYGATLVLRDPADAFAHLRRVDSTILTPSLASVMDPDHFPQLKTVYLVGEAVPQAVCDLWASRKMLYNMYGPTEATCGATIKRLHPKQPLTIGMPNPSTRIYILDHRQRLAPVGRIGEIYLAGVQVAKGYIGQPELTAQRFLPDSICGGLGEYMYKTGDRGYWNEQGEIVFLGRQDRQIKLRGFRIDLEDLEARVLRSCSNTRAVAIARRDDDLVCMIHTTRTDIEKMREEVASVMPAFAVPKRILAVERLPMTKTGKVDYKAVAAAGAAGDGFQPEERFKTETEAVVAATWARVLDVGPRGTAIGPSSNFTAMGGYSLQQLRVAAKLTAVFGVRVTIRMIVELPTLRQLASAIDSMAGGAERKVPEQYRSDHLEPSPLEGDWWLKYELAASPSAFNVSYVARFDPKLVDKSRLAYAWNTVLARHEVFRSRYVKHRRTGLQRVLVPSAPRVGILKSIDVWLELNRPFRLATAPPVRVFITKDTMVATWSHIICDYTALGLILNDVAAVYNREQLDPAVQKLVDRSIVDSAAPPCYLDFWSQYLLGSTKASPSYLGNGSDRVGYAGTSIVGQVSAPLWQQMQVTARKSGLTLQQLVLAGVALALSANDKDMDITLGIPFINRQSEADMHTVGLFLEPLPVRIAFAPSATPEQLYDAAHHGDHQTQSSPTTGHSNAGYQEEPLSRAAYLSSVQASAQRSLSHAIPWHQLLDHLQVDPQRSLPNHPLFDCVVSFNDCRRDASPSSLGRKEGGPWAITALGPGVEPQYVWSEGSKFKLMVEFTAVRDDALLIRLEYDTACFESVGRIQAVRRMILRAIETVIMTAGKEVPGSFRQVREEMHAHWQVEENAEFEGANGVDDRLLDTEAVPFGIPFAEL